MTNITGGPTYGGRSVPAKGKSRMRPTKEFITEMEGAFRLQNLALLKSLAEELEQFNTTESDTLLHLARGMAATLTHDHTEAFASFRIASEGFEGLEDKHNHAKVESSIGNLFHIAGEHQQALERFKQSLETFEELQDYGAVATAQSNIGVVYTAMGKIAEGMNYYLNSLEYCLKVNDANGIARTKSNLANAYRNLGRYEEAITFHKESWATYESLGDNGGVARAKRNLATLYQSIGNYSEALEYNQQALQDFTLLGDNLNNSRTLSGIGLAHEATGNYPLALEYLHRSMDISESINNATGVASAHGNIGNVYLALGSYVEAEQHCRKALELFTHLEAIPNRALAIGNLGHVLRAANKPLEALSQYETSLAIHTELGDENIIATILGDVINVHIELCDYDRAQELLRQQEGLYIADPVARATFHINKGRLLAHDKDLSGALQEYSNALVVAEESGSRKSIASIHLHLRELAQLNGNLAAYIEHNNEYTRITEEINGKETAAKLAMQEAERRISKERTEHEKQRAIFHSALPRHIADRMARGERVSDYFEHAAVMFLDIVGFTELSSSLASSEVVNLLQQIFSLLDDICQQKDIVKIKTIGDCYMAVAFPDEANNDANIGVRVTQAALVMLQSMDSLSISLHFPIQTRIGIHIGPLTAGVLGKERLQYDVWGDTVNVASRMESTGAPGKIQISEALALTLQASTLYPELSEGYRIEPRGEIEIKGKGLMKTYWLLP